MRHPVIFGSNFLPVESMCIARLIRDYYSIFYPHPQTLWGLCDFNIVGQECVGVVGLVADVTHGDRRVAVTHCLLYLGEFHAVDIGDGCEGASAIVRITGVFFSECVGGVLFDDATNG